MNKLVLLDSQILIWGIKRYASEGQQDNIQRSVQFISWLSENHYRILLPVPQVVELLSYAPPEHQSKIKTLFDKRFLVVPFDEMAASKCAELVYLSLNEPDLVKYRNEQKVTKNKIKFDCMLASIAIVRGAHRIYSHDPDMKKFSNGQIEVKEMPQFINRTETDLFGNLLLKTPQIIWDKT